MKQLWKWFSRVMAITATLLIWQPLIGQSEEKKESQVNDFSYEVLFPENQQNKELGYYDLLMKPNQKQTVQVLLTNESATSLKVAIDISSAKTNSSGVIEYGPSELEEDTSLTHDLSQLVTGPKEVTIPKQSQQIVNFNIEMPENMFEGYLAGGIQFMPIVREDSEKTKGVILNEFAFLVGILIHEKDTKGIKPVVALTDVSVNLKQGMDYLICKLSNVSPIFIEDMAITVQVRQKNGSKILFDSQVNNMRMAPNTKMEHLLLLEGRPIKPGTYLASVTSKTTNGQAWTWDKEFSVSKIEAKKIRFQLEQNSEKVPRLWKGWLLLSIFLMVALLVVIYYYRATNKTRYSSLKKNRRK